MFQFGHSSNPKILEKVFVLESLPYITNFLFSEF